MTRYLSEPRTPQISRFFTFPAATLCTSLGSHLMYLSGQATLCTSLGRPPYVPLWAGHLMYLSGQATLCTSLGRPPYVPLWAGHLMYLSGQPPYVPLWAATLCTSPPYVPLWAGAGAGHMALALNGGCWLQLGWLQLCPNVQGP